MAIISVLRKGASLPFKTIIDFGLCKSKLPTINVLRNSGGYDPRKMYIHPTRWAWDKFKDFVHFYFLLGTIPLTVLVTYVNLTVGPAKLREIPEGYEPKHWEYFKHPVERWFSHYVYSTHQEQYEQYLQVVYEEEEKRCMREIAKKVRWLRDHRHDIRDTPGFKSVPLDYIKAVREEYDYERRNYGNP